LSWEEFRRKAKIVEQLFAQRHLSNILWANDYQNIKEHWDVEGELNGKTLKFDIKGLKKTNRWDSKTQDECAWVEGTNVKGQPGWLKGSANYIVFERNDCWLSVNREELLDFVNEKLKKNSYATGKTPYHLYQRDGRKDKITLVPFKDIETLKDARRLEK
jgi:hypothetical protein